MSTRKVKDAKDLETNELIYFKGHAKATYMSDGRSVEEAINDVGNGGVTTETDPIFSASAAAKITDGNISDWNNKVDKVDGKQLSTEDFTTVLKNKLSSLTNYDDTAINQAVQSLQTQLNTLVSGNASTAVESFNEIVAFLEGIEDSQSLNDIIASIEQQIASKQDKITDLETIRSGAALGATAIQEVSSKQDKNLYFTNKVASSWVADSTYDGYAYRCDVSCSGVTADYFAEVIFSPSDATSGKYAPVCETKNDIVSIWSSSDDSITIPTIIINK